MSEGDPMLNNGGPRQRMRSSGSQSSDLEHGVPQHSAHGEKPPHHIPGMPDRVGLKRFKDRFLRRGKRQIGVFESFYNIATSSCRCRSFWGRNLTEYEIVLNLFIVFLPISWALHFHEREHHTLVFACKALSKASHTRSDD